MAGCSTGCSIFVESNQDRVYRLKPRENPHINQWWMCDEGRYGFKHLHAVGRQTIARKRDENGQPQAIEWAEFVAGIIAELKQAGHLALVLSPHLTVEEAYLLGTLVATLTRKLCWRWARFRLRVKTRHFPAASRYGQRSVLIAAESKR